MSPKGTASSDRSGVTGTFTPGRIAITVLVGLLLVLVVVLIFENTRQVRIRLLVPEVSMPLSPALGAVAVIGGDPRRPLHQQAQVTRTRCRPTAAA
ncbi:DUF1049 domain-containing protein [Streptomyces sp. NPDC056656]|uniref:DUF1049 domain-containing protein n=1 Tax=Streptomyces sp. NPDC056656 TaxID=3345895 RepID=UPI0036C44EE4